MFLQSPNAHYHVHEQPFNGILHEPVELTAKLPIVHFNIVAHMLKARTVEPEKQPLLADGSETTLVSG
jgi:hypothetical protein